MKLTIEIDPADLTAAAALFGIRIATPELSADQFRAIWFAYSVVSKDAVSDPLSLNARDRLLAAFPDLLTTSQPPDEKTA